jgi:hypothetical protein
MASAAWQRARAQFPSATAPHVTVRIFPTVELFRQSTNQPGWVAASTQAGIISVEPYDVLAQKQLFAPMLEHEFLHTLVEVECAPAAPLWLREGLVEALSNKPLRANSAAWTIDRLEQQLRAPASQTASAEAHTQAGIRVHEYLRRYGLPGVRQWLRSGVPASVFATSFVIPGNGRQTAAMASNTHTRHANRN